DSGHLRERVLDRVERNPEDNRVRARGVTAVTAELGHVVPCGAPALRKASTDVPPPDRRNLHVSPFVISRAPSPIRDRRGTTSSIPTWAQNAMSSSRPGGPYVRASSPSWASGHARAIASVAFAASDGSAPSSWTIRPAQYASSSANWPWKPAQTIITSSPPSRAVP